MSATSSSAAAAAADSSSELAPAVHSCGAEGCDFTLRFRAGEPRPAFPLAAHTAECAAAQSEMRLACLLQQRGIIDAEIDELEQKKQRGGRPAAKVKRERGAAGRQSAVAKSTIDLVTSDEDQDSEPMGDEGGDHESAAPAAAAAPSPKAKPIKREREDASESATNDAAAKASRTAHSTDASSSAAAAAAAVPSSSRSRIPQAHSAIPPRPQGAPAAAASSVGVARPSDSRRPEPEEDASVKEEKESESHHQQPADVPVPRGFKTVRALKVTTTMGRDPYLHYGGKKLHVYLRRGDKLGCHLVNFHKLFPLMKKNGLLPKKPLALQVDHPSWSAALRLLLYFHENHKTFLKKARIKAHKRQDRYDDPTCWTVLLDGVPYVEVYAIESCLLAQPYLTQTKYNKLDDQANALMRAVEPVRIAEPAYEQSLQAAAQQQ